LIAIIKGAFANAERSAKNLGQTQRTQSVSESSAAG
jgi:hypothetical protein